MAEESLPKTKINSLFPQKTPKNNMFKVVVIFFNVLQFLSGLDFGFYCCKSSKVRICLKLMSLFVSIAFIAVCYSQPGKTRSHVIWSIVSTIKYLTYVIFLLSLKPSLNYCSFLKIVYSTDAKYNLQLPSCKTEVKMFFKIGFCFFFRIIVLEIYWGLNQEWRPDVVKTIQIILLSSLDILLISYASIFSIVESRLEILASLIESSQSNFIALQFIYKSYVDIVYKYKNAFDPVIVISLGYNIPEIMATIYYSFEIIKLQDKWLLFVIMNTEYAMAAEALIMTIAPAVYASKLSAQTDRIRIVLHEKLLLQKTENEIASELIYFIRYVEARRCQFSVNKVIPLDVSLIGMVIRFCVTYLIIIIQFTQDNESW